MFETKIATYILTIPMGMNNNISKTASFLSTDQQGHSQCESILDM